FSPCQGDCDDYDGSANPTQREQCDQFDNDCDGLVDEGFDFDLDGWSICMADCNDAYPEVYPYAPEVCNLVDDDCDRIVDEGFDQDFDGWAVCEGDCDDRLATVNPGAGNCPPDSLLGEDGSLATAIEGEIPLEEAEAQVAGEDVGARAGTALRAAGDVDGDGWGDLWIGAPGGGPKGGGLACWFRGPLPPTVLELADAAACLGGEVGGDGLGSALASGDLDGDRLPELLAGAPGASGGAGQVRIVPGASAGV
ncbi:putative metal-binding motif-containing protein, partial [Myxococcota bacterium]|nr:putative metal-binding motif-containing protein [Myxococcota bacterium]